jgi:hypothetical protein
MPFEVGPGASSPNGNGVHTFFEQLAKKGTYQL